MKTANPVFYFFTVTYTLESSQAKSASPCGRDDPDHRICYVKVLCKVSEMSQTIIFTDLDGTLLDHETYSFGKANEALHAIKSEKIPLVICSSKTRAEIEKIRIKLGNTSPFISENGGGIFIPSGYFGGSEPNWENAGGGCALIRLGAKYDDLRDAIVKLRFAGFDIRGFGDMAADEIAKIAGLDLTDAELAKLREFDEPFTFYGADKASLRKAIEQLGLHHTMGRYHHILGDSDKGKAVSILAGMYRRKFGDITTVGIGDSPNDVPMFLAVDIPVVVQQPDGKYHPEVEAPGIRHAGGIGPAGWNKAVLEIMGQR